jgi:hypothetical protein
MARLEALQALLARVQRRTAEPRGTAVMAKPARRAEHALGSEPRWPEAAPAAPEPVTELVAQPALQETVVQEIEPQRLEQVVPVPAAPPTPFALAASAAPHAIAAPHALGAAQAIAAAPGVAPAADLLDDDAVELVEDDVEPPLSGPAPIAAGAERFAEHAPVGALEQVAEEYVVEDDVAEELAAEVHAAEARIDVDQARTEHGGREQGHIEQSGVEHDGHTAVGQTRPQSATEPRVVEARVAAAPEQLLNVVGSLPLAPEADFVSVLDQALALGER